MNPTETPFTACWFTALLLGVSLAVVACSDSGSSSGGLDTDNTADTGADTPDSESDGEADAESDAGSDGPTPDTGADVSSGTCDDDGTVELGVAEGFFIGDCGYATRSFVLDVRTGVMIDLELAVDGEVSIWSAGSEVLAPVASTDPGAEVATTLDEGTYELRVEGDEPGDVTGGGIVTLFNACEVSPPDLAPGDETTGELADGDCQMPGPSDLFRVSTRLETRYLFELEATDFSPTIEVLDEATGDSVVDGSNSVDVTLPIGGYLVRVHDAADGGSGSYTVRATALDECDPAEIAFPAVISGDLSDGDCAEGDLRTDNYAFESAGFTLVRAEFAATAGSANAGDHVNAITNNGAAGSSVTASRRGEDGRVVASWTGVLDSGRHVWSVSRLFDGVTPPADGMVYAGGIAEPPASHCAQHINAVPIAGDVTFEDQTLWDCVDDGQNVSVYSITVPEFGSLSVSVWAPNVPLDRGMKFEILSAGGTVLRTSPLAFGDQFAAATSAVNAGMSWIVISGANTTDRFQLSIRF